MSGTFKQLARAAASIGMIASVGVVLNAATPGSIAVAAPGDTLFSDTFSGGAGNSSSSGYVGWTESGDDSSAGAGRIRIESGDLRFQNLDNASLQRTFDTSALAGLGALIQFDVVDESGNEAVQVLVNGVEVGMFDEDDDGDTITFYPGELTPSTTVTFRSDPTDTDWSGGEYLEIDDFEIIEHAQENPDLPFACGVDVTIVLDESGSVEDEEANVKNATIGLLNGLEDTNSNARLVEFSTQARNATPPGYTAAFAPVDSTYVSAVDDYFDDVNTSTGSNHYDPDSWTNWESAMKYAAGELGNQSPGDLVVFITDGDPNTVHGGGGGNSGNNAAALAAADEVDSIQATGAHVLGIAVGAGISSNTSFNRLVEVIEAPAAAAQTWSGTGPLDVTTVDVLKVTNFDDLEAAMRQVVYALCSPSVSVTKVDQDDVSVPDHPFTGTATVAGNSFEWASPNAGQIVNGNPATDTATVTTGNAGGAAVFQWTPGTRDNPQPWDSSFTFTETVPAGWRLGDQHSCTVRRLTPDNGQIEFGVGLVANPATANAGDQVSFVMKQLDNGNVTNNDFVVERNDIVTCRVENVQLATITIAKDAVPNSGQTFDFSGIDGGFSLVDNGTDPNSQTFTVVPGDYTVAEIVPTDWVLSDVSCSATQGSDAAHVNGDIQQGTVISVAKGGTVTCTYVNHGRAQLQLAKDWLIADPGETAQLTADVLGQPGLQIDETFAAPNDQSATPDHTTGAISIPLNTDVALAELVSNGAAYTSTLVCSDDVDGSDVFTLSDVDADGRSGTLVASDGAVGAMITCTFQNPSSQVDITVEKALVPNTDDGTFDLSINGNVVVDDGGHGANNDASQVTANVGDVITLEEAAGSGTNLDWYTLQSLECSYNDYNGAPQTITPDGGGQFTVPFAAAGGGIDCTFTNARNTANLVLDKNWSTSPQNGDAVDLTISGGLLTPTTGTDSNDGNDGNDSAATADVYVGEVLQLAESFTPANHADWYTTGLSCAGGSLNPANDRVTIVPADANGTVTCTYTNTRNSANLTVLKTWDSNVADGETAQLTALADGAARLSSAATEDVPTDPAHGSTYVGSNTATVFAGENIAIDETLANGDNYTSSYACAGVTASGDGNGRSTGFTVPDEPGNITCTFTNSRKIAGVTLTKEWVAATDGATADLSLVVQGDPSSEQTATATAGGASPTLTLDVAAGDTVALSEVLGADSANYVSSWECTFGGNQVAGGSGTSGTLPITAAMAEATAGNGPACVFTNTGVNPTIKFVKTTIGGVGTFDLTVDDVSGAPSPDYTLSATTTTAGVPASSALQQLAVGTAYAVAETPVAGWDAGALSCQVTNNNSSTVWNSGDTANAGDTIECAVTNTKTGPVSVTKDIATDGDVELIDAATNRYRVSYDVSVSSASNATETFTLNDTLTYGAGTTVASVAVVDGAAAPAHNPNYDGDADTVLATGSIDFGDTFTYTITVEFTVAPSTTAAARDCDLDGQEDGTGTLNTATVAWRNNTSDPATACDEIPNPDVSVTKTARANQPVHVDPADAGGNLYSYDVTYDIVITNNGEGPGTYTATDLPGFSAAATAGTPTWDPSLPAGDIELGATDGAAGGTDEHSYAVTIRFTIDPRSSLADRDCGAAGQQDGTGLYNEVIVDPNIGPDASDDDCVDMPDPNITIDKSLADGNQPVANADGTFTVSYNVTVTNSGDGPGNYDVTDTPAFGAGITPTAVAVDGTEVLDAADGAADGTYLVAADVDIEAGGEDAYVVAVTLTVDPGTPSAARQCASGQGAFTNGTANSATVSSQNPDDTDDACADVPDPNITVDKSVDAAIQPVANPDGSFTATYTVTVQNDSEGPGEYDLTDTPTFGAGTNITKFEVTPPGGTATEVLGGPVYPLGSNVAIDGTLTTPVQHVYLVAVTFNVDAGSSATDRDCDLEAGENGTGALNTVEVVSQSGTDNDAACVPTPGADISVTKTVIDAANQPTLVSGNTYEIDYEVTVTNTGAAAATYSAADLPSFVTGANVTNVSSTPALPTAGSPQAIAAGVSDVYTVTVTFTIDPATDATARVCDPSTPTPGVGLYNQVTVTPSIGNPTDADTCAGLPDPDIVVEKSVSAGPSLDSGVWTIDYQVAVTNNGDGPGTYSLADTPAFGTGATITGVAIDDTPVTPAPAGTFDIVPDATPVSINAGETDTYKVTVSFTVDPAMEPDARVCEPGTPGSGTFNTATVTPNIGDPTSDDACEPIPGSGISVSKADPTEVTLVSGNEYATTYRVTVTNTGQGPGEYDLVDTLGLPSGVTETGMTVTLVGGTSPDLPTIGATVSLPLSSIDIAPGSSHEFDVAVTFTVGATVSPGDRECTDPGEAGNGAYNTATVTVDGEDNSDDGCIDIPDPSLSVSKTVDAATQPVLNGDGSYSVTYDISVTNSGEGPGAYTLTDAPGFGVGATITGVMVDGTPIDPLPDPLEFAVGSANAPLNAGATDSYEVVVTFTIDPDMVPTERHCETDFDENGRGTFNSVSADFSDGTSESDDACVPIPDPDFDIDKSAVGIEQVSGFDYDATYTITVTNTGAGHGTYDLADLPGFPVGSTVNSVTATLDGSGVTLPIGGKALNAGSSDVYTVVVNVTIDGSTNNSDRLCATDQISAGQGGYNSATVTWGDDSVVSDDDCVDLPEPDTTMTKTATSSTATFIGNDRYTASYQVSFTNSGDGPGVYSLLESPAVTNADVVGLTVNGTAVSPLVLPHLVTSNNPIAAGDTESYNVVVTFEINGAIAGNAATCASGDDATGGLVNIALGTIDGEEVDDSACVNAPEFDLQITKVDGGAQAVAGGEPFGYTITISNIGDRDADPSEPITVTDELPAGLSWVTVPTDCSTAGRTMTCDIDPLAMTVGGSVVLRPVARAAADTASGVYTNVAIVTTEDDPVCEGDGCTPPPCPATSNNNVDCEPTPVPREGDIEIVKLDNVADGESVAPGEAFEYNLRVTNTGLATILPGLEVTDDLPDQLTLVSVQGGTGWTCNAVNPVVCNYGPTLNPAATTPPITIEVVVNSTVTVANIDNVAVVRGAIDRSCSVPSGDTAFEPACNEVTDDDSERTPVTGDADLSIVKSSDIDQVAPGDSFVWSLSTANDGPGNAIDVVVGDVLPDSVVVNDVSSEYFDCSFEGQEVTCTRALMQAGDTGRVDLGVTVVSDTEGGVLTNLGTIESASTPDPDPDNNDDEDDVTIVIVQPPTTTNPPPTTLPATGASTVLTVMQLGAWFLAAGAIVLLITRRRRRVATN